MSIGGVEAAYNRDFDYVEKIELDMVRMRAWWCRVVFFFVRLLHTQCFCYCF